MQATIQTALWSAQDVSLISFLLLQSLPANMTGKQNCLDFPCENCAFVSHNLYQISAQICLCFESFRGKRQIGFWQTLSEQRQTIVWHFPSCVVFRLWHLVTQLFPILPQLWSCPLFWKHCCIIERQMVGHSYGTCAHLCSMGVHEYAVPTLTSCATPVICIIRAHYSGYRWESPLQFWF